MVQKLLIKEIYLPIIYIAVGYIIYKVITKIIHVAMNHKQGNLPQGSYNYKKIETFKVLSKNVIKCIVIMFVVLACLPIYGIDISSILAGLGIVSAVLALSLQDILKDFFGGLTIILENQFAIGDTISVNGFKGEVISIGLKSTRVRNFEGYVKIIANRNINEVINYSSSYSLAIVDVGVSYEDDLDKVEQVLTDLAKELSKSMTKLKGQVEVLGIESLDSSAVIYRMTVKTKSMEHFRIQREMKKAIKLRLDEEKIKIPYTQIEVHDGNK